MNYKKRIPILNYLSSKIRIPILNYLSGNLLDTGGLSTYIPHNLASEISILFLRLNVRALRPGLQWSNKLNFNVLSGNIMKLNSKSFPDSPGLNIKQKRSRKTYDALIKAGFKLLRTHSWESITISELSKTAGYSVGAFYARFKSKDELFDALIANQSQTRKVTYEHLFSKFQNDDLLDEIIKDLVQYFRNRCNFWRAAQARSIRDPDFWEQIRQDGHGLASMFTERLRQQINRPLTDSEEINVRFAFQVVNGTINSAIINRPGPILMNQKLFTEKLIRVFRLVSNYDNFDTKKT